MKKLFLVLLTLAAVLPLHAATPPTTPRLVVQIVIGSMRAEDLDRYARNFGNGGFRRFIDNGTLYTDASYDYQQTTTPVSLATLTTGAMPSTHGVIGEEWQDYTRNVKVRLTEGSKGEGAYHLIAPTLGDALTHHLPQSHTATVATESTSAVVMGGHTSEVYWLGEQCGWATSAYYKPELPEWIRHINKEKYNLSYLTDEWRALYDRQHYLNTRCHDIIVSGRDEKPRRNKKEASAPYLPLENDYEHMLYTPAGNTAVLGFAKQLIVQNRLGDDMTTDLLNICLDSPRRITEAYGPESVEVEDMYYRLDRDLSDFMTFLLAQIRNEEVLVVLTSDHGTSPSYNEGPVETERFHPHQFEVIVNSFLNVRYGSGKWVTAYNSNCIWLNHNLIYERGLNLSEVQNEVAIFAMQFGGVSHALAATAMRTSYFGSGYARRLQNSFYPRRSGDVVINLMPGWIENRERTVSSSGSMYGYDTAVPLAFYGMRIIPQRISREVDMTSLAPTLAHRMGISNPAASEGDPLSEIIE